jgi:hypothetical protein
MSVLAMLSWEKATAAFAGHCLPFPAALRSNQALVCAQVARPDYFRMSRNVSAAAVSVGATRRESAA